MPSVRLALAALLCLSGVLALLGPLGPLAPDVALGAEPAAAPPLVPAPPAPAGEPAATPVPPDALRTIGLDEVKVGQRGYGLSVFAGGKPERFDVEVIGVMRNLNPGSSYILARLSGHGLESSGIAAGMSGSPVFLDGRLAGAVAFGWPFSKEAIGGITPIASMRRLTALDAGPVAIAPPPPVRLATLAGGDLPDDLLVRELSRFRPRLGGVPGGAVPSVEWSAAGFGELASGVLREGLGNVVPAGQVSALGATAPAAASGSRLAPGSAVAAVLVNGDFQLAATGTVTDAYGDHVLAFGHPFLGRGPLRVPMARVEVVTVLSSQYSSFKIANLGEIVGAFEQDRQAGIVGRIGSRAPMIPMSLRVAGGDGKPRDFHVGLAEVPEVLPSLAGSTLLAGLESASYAEGQQSLDLSARFRMAGYGDLSLRQTFDGEKVGSQAAGYLLTILSYLVQNPLEQVAIESLDVELRQSPRPLAVSLVSGHAVRTAVRPGDTVGVDLDLIAYRGERFSRRIQVPLPEDLQAGRYSLLVGDGASADSARLALEPTDPLSFRQALAQLRRLHSRRDLTVLGLAPASGLSVAGEVMPLLPGSVRSLWSGGAGTGGAVPLRTTIVQERHEPLEAPLEGLVRLDLEILPRDTVRGPGVRPPAGPEPAAAPARRNSTATPAPAQPSGGPVATGAHGDRR